MKRYLIILISAALIVTVFTACKKKNTDEPSVNSSRSTDNSTDQLVSADDTIANEPLQIICYGENGIGLQITNEEISKLLGNAETKGNKYIEIAFFAENQQKLGLHMDSNGWNLSKVDNEAGATASGFDTLGQGNTYLISGNTVSIEVNQGGIVTLLKSCDNYSIMVFDATTDKHEMLSGGNLSEVLTSEASDNGMELLYTSADRAVVRVFGEEFTTYLGEHEGEKICVNFYLPDSGNNMPDYIIRLGGYSANLYQCSYQKADDGSYKVNEAELLGTIYNSATTIENGYSASVYYKDLKALLSTCDHINVTDGQDKTFLSMKYDTTVKDARDSITPIPNEFLPCDKDDTYFCPVTEDYMVIMVKMPKCSFFDYRIGIAPNGNKYYGPVGTHEASITVVTLISYDEFGIADQKTKIIYDSIEEAMTASATQTDRLPAEQLSGDASDDAIMADFFEQLDRNVFGTARYEEPLYQYYGHFDKVRYFNADWKNINYINLKPYFPSYDRNTQFDSNGYFTENASYQYIYSHIEPGLGYSENREATENITAFYSKASKEKAD